jgi:hypothetical protein
LGSLKRQHSFSPSLLTVPAVAGPMLFTGLFVALEVIGEYDALF